MMDSSDGLPQKMTKDTIIPNNFYTGTDVVSIARQLPGKLLVHQTPQGTMAGFIIETEAYAGITDKASHAYNGRMTKRTEVLYRNGGIAYVYLCYGLHALLNVVTNTTGVPHAVLIRGVLPVQGLDLMEERINREIDIFKDGIGPGRLTRIMGITMDLNGLNLNGSSELLIIEKGLKIAPKMIKTGPRIGVDYAGDDALLPYRFRIDASYALQEIKKAGLFSSQP